MSTVSIRRYLFYSATFNGARAYVNSTVILYLVDVAKLPVSATALLLAADLFFTLLFEMPTGIYADRSGRHRSFSLACGLTFLGYATYALLPWLTLRSATTETVILIALLAEVIGSVGFAFQSGALDAWIVQQLRSRDRTDDIAPTLAQGQASKNFAYMVAGITGIGHYYLFSLTQPMLSTFAVSAIILLALTILTIGKNSAEQSQSSANSFQADDLKNLKLSSTASIFLKTWSDLFLNKKLLAIIVAGTTSYTLLQLLAFYWPYLLVKEILHSHTSAETLVLTVSWLVGYGFRGLGNYSTTLILARTRMPIASIAISVVASTALTLMLYLLAVVVILENMPFVIASIATFLYGLIRFADGFADPLRQWFIAEVGSHYRLATMYSLSSSFSLGVSALAVAFAAYLLDHGASVSLLIACSAILQLLSAPLYVYAAKR